MKVLITGACGVIGRSLVADCIARGDEVVGTSHSACALPSEVDFHLADVGDATAMSAALEGVEVVHHLAAAHRNQSTPESEYHRVNVDAVRQLVQLAAKAGVRRFVHCSSVGVYGDIENPPAAEDAPKHPGNIYERTKHLGETAALEEGAKHDMEVVVVRPAWVYCAGCPKTRRLLRTVARGRFFYFGNGSNLRHPIHLDDVIASFHLAATEGPDGAIYNIAGPRALALSEVVDCAAAALGVGAPRLKIPFAIGWCGAVVAEALFAVLPKSAPITRRSLVFFANANAFTIDAAAEGLGFEPVVSVEEGMARVVADLGGKEGVLAGDGEQPPGPVPPAPTAKLERETAP